MYLQGRGNEYWSIIPDITRVGHDIDPTECRTWCPPQTGSIAEPLQSYRKGQSNALAKRIMAMVGQDKPIRTKLLKPQTFGRDKDRADATTYLYKADQNDGVGLYYVMVTVISTGTSLSPIREPWRLLSMQPPPSSGKGHRPFICKTFSPKCRRHWT